MCIHWVCYKQRNIQVYDLNAKVIIELKDADFYENIYRFN